MKTKYSELASLNFFKERERESALVPLREGEGKRRKEREKKR
jgi:hypothetical protein